MDKSEIKKAADHTYGESIARVVWAAHILSYLTGEQSHAETLQSETGDEDEDDSDGSESDAETDKWSDLTSADKHIRSKFLDCVAELLSPENGWDHVVAVGLLECEDFIEIDVARNDGFHAVKSQQGGSTRAEGAGLQYIEHLREYLSSILDQDLCEQSAMSSSWFEPIAIGFNCKRIDYWLRVARRCILCEHPFKAPNEKLGPGFKEAVKTWTNMEELLRHTSSSGLAVSKEEIVRCAYECISSMEVHDLLETSCRDKVGPKLWRALRSIARPVSNCRLLARIASHVVQLRTVKVCPIPSGPETILTPEYLIDITDALDRLVSVSLAGPALKRVTSFRKRFKQACARPLRSHAEVQLFLHYEDGLCRAPSIDYFGCSKKSCFLCEGFLRALPLPISTRGRHGICYRAWGVPFSKSDKVVIALEELGNNLASRIEKYLKGQLRSSILNQVPQSAFVSGLSSSSSEELRWKKEMVDSVKEDQKSRQKERRILDGRVSTTKPATTFAEAFETYESCVMCNSSPAKLCARCKACHYCSRDCQRSDWPCHKLLCKDMSSQAPRPSLAHKRAILFPQNEAKPFLVWVLCSRNVDSQNEDDERQVEYETAGIQPLLGMDKPIFGTVPIERNCKRARNLGSRRLTLTFRDAFLKDGSTINRGILNSVKLSGTVHHSWCGPVVAMRETLNGRYEDITLDDFRHEDITLDDFRHVIDYFVTYNKSETPEITAPLDHKCTGRTIRGVKICCYGENKLHGAEPYIPVEVEEMHPARSLLSVDRNISPISKLLESPLRLWRFAESQTWVDTPGWNYNMSPEGNQDAALLMTETDLGNEFWGWAPLSWNIDIGNVLVIRADGTDLYVDELRLMCYFIRRKLRPKFEDALGMTSVLRTRSEVLNFINRENLEKCKAEMAKDLSSYL
ncbi:uncharacterized protein PV06_00107 [Exophiala oligosperma]|uniref:MYND-type domain-containing protein n=1 Tax=Exophiala oligosperma TaxID=215243 RepID=A0A0D2DXQ6_9EURO|nr:uncharacterized protein PV06_00107 [Exophiala oligosperma]KIW47410.1 hypothetical protein PV06_00107 [Exophiala oligosperma]